MTADEEKAIQFRRRWAHHSGTQSQVSDKRFRTDLRSLVRFLVETGLRAGEVCNLRWPDVDWQAGMVTRRAKCSTPR